MHPSKPPGSTPTLALKWRHATYTERISLSLSFFALAISRSVPVQSQKEGPLVKLQQAVASGHIRAQSRKHDISKSALHFEKKQSSAVGREIHHFDFHWRSGR